MNRKTFPYRLQGTEADPGPLHRGRDGAVRSFRNYFRSNRRSIARRVALLLLLVLLLVPGQASATLNDAWVRIQQALHEGADAETIRERMRVLEERAVEVDTRRLTPYAEVLVAWANEHPDELGITVVGLAERIDPLLPAAPFLAARLHWRSGSYFSALTAYFRGWSCAFREGGTRRELLSSLIVWTLLALGFSLVIVVILQTVRHLRLVAHDAYELGMLLFRRSNAVVFAAVVLTLPLFAGLGPLWLLAYVFSLSWPYLAKTQRIAAGVICFLLMTIVPLLEIWQGMALQASPVGERVVQMLEERRIDPSTLRDYAELAPNLDSSSTYHLILGELMRLHGDAAAAREEYREASIASSDNDIALIFRGNMAAEIGDMKRAIELYNDAVQINPRSALAYLNLSFALDQDTRFEEAGNARRTAQSLLPKNVRLNEIGVRGSQPRIRFPRLGRPDMDRMRAELTPQARLLLGEDRSSTKPLAAVLNPFSAVFCFAALLGFVSLGLRAKWMWTGQACAKCGKVFCPRCKSSTESASYCSQCISVFLKRDEVAMDQQQAKLAQIQRWKNLSSIGSRIVAIVLPGGGLVLEGKLWQGALLGFGGWLFLIGLLMWAPLFLPSIEPWISALPTQVLLGLFFLAVWMLSITLTWNRR